MFICPLFLGTVVERHCVNHSRANVHRDLTERILPIVSGPINKIKRVVRMHDHRVKMNLPIAMGKLNYSDSYRQVHFRRWDSIAVHMMEFPCFSAMCAWTQNAYPVPVTNWSVGLAKNAWTGTLPLDLSAISAGLPGLLLLTPSLPQPVKFPGWKMHGRAYKQYIFRSYDASTFSAMRFDENPLTWQCETRRQKRLKGFRFGSFVGRFSDIKAVKGLTESCHTGDI